MKAADAASQVVFRDGVAEWVSALSIVATVCEAIALEVRHGQRTEVRELSEPFGKGQKGSSAMPHKKNPIISERIAGMARIVRAQVMPVTEGIPLWHERDISHSSTERIALPDASIATDYILNITLRLVTGLVVDKDRMRANLDATGGLIYSSQRPARAGRDGLQPRGLVRDRAVRSDGHLEHRRPVPRDPAQARRRQGGSSWTRRGSTRSAGRALPRTPRRRLRPGRGAVMSTPLERSLALDHHHLHSGKVRELYAVGDDQVLMVASDRISAYDHILPTEIPDKGAILTALTLWWFEQLADVVDNHLVTADVAAYPHELQPYADVLRGRSMLCRRLDMVPVECVARGYLAGSGFVDYTATGSVCGIPLPAGLLDGRGCPSRSSRRPPRPPSATTTRTSRTRPSPPQIGDPTPPSCADHPGGLLPRGRDRGRARHHHRRHQARVRPGRWRLFVLGDEVLTPDSSRFWPADTWQPGGAQPSYDKQYVRDWLRHESGWDRASQPPACRTRWSRRPGPATSRRTRG